MEFFRLLYNLLRHLGEDSSWQSMVDYVGVHTLYIVLFAIVFCETGLVVTPFLPGDSLIFAIGAVAARNIGIEISIIGPLLLLAALVGDNVNYWLGRKLGPAVFKREGPESFREAATSQSVEYRIPNQKKSIGDMLLNRKHLDHAQAFYDKHGSKTVILARFVPIVRTFAPFVAGIGKMNYARFLLFSVVGAVAWVSLCLAGGFFLGSRPFFKKHFELVIVAIVIVSVIPVMVEFFKARRALRTGRGDVILEATTFAEHSDRP